MKGDPCMEAKPYYSGRCRPSYARFLIYRFFIDARLCCGRCRHQRRSPACRVCRLPLVTREA
ncbi:hypothetical protein BRADI_1g12765v3 [Brachypodium distachyon]|uniref:Uncharacterized protein n=1 Tax=Brachypodium distachyon TaxID=15368 RepID=A0A2K2DJ81_BRADI|nr:hypothetical protein BRADI_1g12765v3 [Brachypodium distachyon]